MGRLWQEGDVRDLRVGGVRGKTLEVSQAFMSGALNAEATEWRMDMKGAWPGSQRNRREQLLLLEQ